MTPPVSIGPYEFDSATYDSEADVLYLRKGPAQEAASTQATPEGHAVRFDERGDVIGLTVVNARWLVERDGKLALTLPTRVETDAASLASVLTD
jgi:uncharacterized protein YuzE